MGKGFNMNNICTRRQMCGIMLLVCLSLGLIIQSRLLGQTLPALRGQSISLAASAASAPASQPSDHSSIEALTAKAVAGDAESQAELGMEYARGYRVPQDFKEAVKWFRKAAGQGDAPAQFSLGEIYHNGRVVPKDDKKAVEWYRKAAEQGFAPAQASLGFMYGDGRGVPQDDKEAVQWDRKAAEQGYAPAQFNLGKMLEDGSAPLVEAIQFTWQRGQVNGIE